MPARAEVFRDDALVAEEGVLLSAGAGFTEVDFDEEELRGDKYPTDGN